MLNLAPADSFDEPLALHQHSAFDLTLHRLEYVGLLVDRRSAERHQSRQSLVLSEAEFIPISRGQDKGSRLEDSVERVGLISSRNVAVRNACGAKAG